MNMQRILAYLVFIGAFSMIVISFLTLHFEPYQPGNSRPLITFFVSEFVAIGTLIYVAMTNFGKSISDLKRENSILKNQIEALKKLSNTRPN